ncbi:PEP-CTERM sorting domain-containing protein [Roseateles saccharophilus]|nr:PEP-CTERM sorting domain-containing protein [Roseateles saccharophilus]
MTTAVPEPAPSALLLAGVAVLGGMTWRCRRR